MFIEELRRFINDDEIIGSQNSHRFRKGLVEEEGSVTGAQSTAGCRCRVRALCTPVGKATSTELREAAEESRDERGGSPRTSPAGPGRRTRSMLPKQDNPKEWCSPAPDAKAASKRQRPSRSIRVVLKP